MCFNDNSVVRVIVFAYVISITAPTPVLTYVLSSCAAAYSNTWRESRLRLVGSSPPEYMKIDGDKRLKLKDMPRPRPQTYQQGYACPSITILQVGYSDHSSSLAPSFL